MFYLCLLGVLEKGAYLYIYLMCVNIFLHAYIRPLSFMRVTSKQVFFWYTCSSLQFTQNFLMQEGDVLHILYMCYSFYSFRMYGKVIGNHIQGV